MLKTNRIYGAVALALLSMGSANVNAEINVKYEPSRISSTVYGDNGAIYNFGNLDILALNNRGEFIGTGIVQDNNLANPTYAAFWRAPESGTKLPNPAPYARTTSLKLTSYDLNDNGEVVGYFENRSSRHGLQTTTMFWDIDDVPLNYSTANPGRIPKKINNSGQFLADSFFSPVELYLYQNYNWDAARVAGYYNISGVNLAKADLNNNGSLIASPNIIQADELGGSYVTNISPNGSTVTTFDTVINQDDAHLVLPMALNDNEIIAGYSYIDYSTTPISSSHKCYYMNMNQTTQFEEFDGTIYDPIYNDKCEISDINNNNWATANIKGLPGGALKRTSLVYDINDRTYAELISLIEFNGSGVQKSELENKIVVDFINDNGDIIAHSVTSSDITTYQYYYLKAVAAPGEISITKDNDTGSYNWDRDWLVLHGKIRAIIPLDGGNNPPWTSVDAGTDDVGNDHMVADQSSTTGHEFTWNIDIDEERTDYKVFASWPVNAANDSGATYSIYLNGALAGTYVADQRLSHTGSEAGYTELTFGQTFPAGSTVTVKLTGSGTGNLIADAIKVTSPAQ